MTDKLKSTIIALFGEQVCRDCLEVDPPGANAADIAAIAGELARATWEGKQDIVAGLDPDQRLFVCRAVLDPEQLL